MNNIEMVGNVKIAVKKAVLVINQIIEIRFYMKVDVILHIFFDNSVSYA
jgi:hypothetical protein